jgi:hypothetical protein
MKKKYFYLSLFLIILIFESKSYSVPISFLKSDTGNMRNIEWERLESSEFDIYYPKDAFQMGKYSLHSAQNAYPYISLLLGIRVKNDPSPILVSQQSRTIISKFDRIPYILGNMTEGAGFANPVSLNIEAQMMHSRTASFFQHELVHRLMYEHNDFSVGPAGRVFSLAMFPTWWIEGLAEYLTESIGKNQTDNITRYMAINDYWPSWDRMHALYNADGDTNLRGYVTSGRFLGWIFSKNKEKDLYKIHEQISKQTILPPFYNASDVWLNENLGSDGEHLYTEFQKEQKSYWENYLNHMPSLFDEKSWDGEAQIYYYPTLIFNNKAIFSKMLSNLSPYNSSLYLKDFNSNKETRIPLSNPGSQLFATNSFQDGIILTANLKRFANATKGHELIALSFKGSLSEISNDNILNQKIIQFATPSLSLVIDQIQSSGDGKFFVSASSSGDSKIYLINVLKGSVTLLKEYPFPASIKLIQNFSQQNELKCANLIFDNDLENTSIEKICEDGFKIQVLPSKVLNIKDAYILHDGTLRILTPWGKIMSLVDYTPQKEIKPIAAFPDWIEGITPWEKDSNKYLGTWVYKKGKYFYKKIDLDAAREAFKKWRSGQNENSTFLKFPKFKNDLPPFVEIYNQQKQSLLGNDIQEFEKNLPKETVAENTQVNQGETSNDNKEKPSEVTQMPATYRNNFLFAYPYAVPDFLGGPSIGLFAIPFTDEMERYQIQVFGGYNFFLNAPSGAVTYVNNRFLDSFTTSLYATPFFNGYYDLVQTTSSGTNTYRYYNYLQQIGLNIAGSWKFRPYSSSFQSMFSLYKLAPYQSLITAPQSVGAQNALMASATGLFSFNTFNTGFYLAHKETPNGEWMNWKTDMTLGGGKYDSLGNSTDSLGQNSGNIDYYNVNSSILSTFSLYKQNFSVLGKVSTTQGADTLNMKETYSPYQSYILGSTTSLNYVSYPLLGSGSLFELSSGYWSYSGTMSYDFPLYPSFEKKFLMSFVDNLRGVVSLTRGGVSIAKDFSTYNSITSASVGTTMTVDIKGFQLFPSLIYGWIVGQENNWYVLMQVKFMDIM